MYLIQFLKEKYVAYDGPKGPEDGYIFIEKKIIDPQFPRVQFDTLESAIGWLSGDGPKWATDLFKKDLLTPVKVL